MVTPDSVREKIKDEEQEQLSAHETDSQDINPRGQHRQQTGFLISRREERRSESIKTEGFDSPVDISFYWEEYYIKFPLTRAALQKFSQTVIEPGYQIRCFDENDNPDEEMQEALDFWTSQCVIHAGEVGHDLSVLLEMAPSQRRGRGIGFIEKVGTREEPDALAALMYLDPSTFKIYKRDDQNIVVQPDDEVEEGHPRTPETPEYPDGKAAAYVQYDETLNARFEKEPIAFAADDLIKIVFDPDVGEAWGRSIFEAIEWFIERLKQKLRDRDASIRISGHPWRVVSSDTWNMGEAEEFADAHEEERTTAWDLDEEEDSFAGRIDFVPASVNIETNQGSVPDIDDAIMDDIQMIFSELPISRFKIAYEEDINQFVVTPQQQEDDRLVDHERRYLERNVGQPILEQKANELAGGEYAGRVEFSIEQPEYKNPLLREDFDSDKFEEMMNAFANYAQKGGDAIFGMELPFFLSGLDKDMFMEHLEQEFDIDESDEEVRQAAEDMGIGTDESEDEMFAED